MTDEVVKMETAQGLTIAYHDEGEGAPVLFLHGSGPGAGGWSNFGDNAQALASGGFRALVPDLPGYGASDKPSDQAYTLDFFAAAATDFLDALDISSCALVGNSLGGALAIKLALDDPKRFEKLILMAPGSLEETKTYMKMKGIQKMAMTFMSDAPDRESLRETLNMMVHDPVLITEALLDRRFEVFATQPKEVLTTMQVPNQADRVGELTAPLLVFWGMADHLCPVSGAYLLMEKCAQIRAILIGRCGHWVMVEHRDLFNRMALDFLRHG